METTENKNGMSAEELLMKKIKETLDSLIEESKQVIWIDPKTADNDETLGIIISKYTEWSGGRIEKVAMSAFEDANFNGVEISGVE